MSAINRLLLTGATAALLTLSASTAEARPFRVTQLPNGADFGCTSCHTGSSGGPRNAFGSAVASGFTSSPSSAPAGWGPVLAGQDSDGDGFTNGEELGDPDGTWTVGDPNPTFDATNPGDPDSFPAVTDPDAGSDTGADSGTDATEDTNADTSPEPDTAVEPDTTPEPDTAVDPDTTPEPDTAVDPDTTPSPDTAVEPDTTPSPDTTTDDAATSADTGTTGATDDRKVADDGCSAAGNGGASMLALLGLALLARRRRA
jgi:uncharacterized protein (TIGR03382 family)